MTKTPPFWQVAAAFKTHVVEICDSVQKRLHFNQLMTDDQEGGSACVTLEVCQHRVMLARTE